MLKILLKKCLKNMQIMMMFNRAGTVLDDITARIAIMKGAKFIVSPHLDVNIAKVCNRYGILWATARCQTVTEIVKALESGADIVKLFPETY